MNEKSTEILRDDPGAGSCVLVAVDFSDDSQAALLWACHYSDLTARPLVVLHVIHDPASDPGFYKDETRKELEPMQDVAERKMDDFLTKTKERHPEYASLARAETHLLPGLPPSRIIEVARLLKASVIVMGSRGRTGLSNILLGTVTDRVVKLATRPVVVIKAEASEARKKQLEKAKKKLKKERKQLKKMLGIKQ